MNKKQKTRYLVAIYLILAFLAVIFVLVSFDTADDNWRSIFLNLATEFIGAAFIFVVVRFLFFVDDWELSENINKLLSRLEIGERPSAGLFFQPRPDLSSYIQTAKKIELCGVSRLGTLHKHLDALEKRLADGCEIRVLIVDDEAESAVKTTGLKSALNDANYFSNQIKQSKTRLAWLCKDLQELQVSEKHKNGSLEIRLLQYSPSFGLSAFDSDESNGVVFIEIFPQKSPGKSPEFELTSQKDGEWYQYFMSQFDIMWEHATCWPSVNVPDEKLS